MITADSCQTCGACCGSPRPVTAFWVNCTDADVKRMSMRRRLKLVPVRDEDGRKSLATPLVNGRCVFLRGTIGVKTKCGIYDERPTLCRKYEPGSEYCRASRAEIGLSS